MKRLWPHRIRSDREAWESLLREQGIRPEKNLDATYGIYEGERLIATGSRFQNIIKCIAIVDDYKGGSVYNELLSEIINELYNLGYTSCYIYTKPEAAKGFSFLGFRLLEEVPGKLAFLERSTSGFDAFLDDLKSHRVDAPRVGTIVMNANPFTNGHLALVEKARSSCDVLHIFVVSEERSTFPHDVRRRLIEEGTAHLSNVFIHETGPYIVSAATFPSYFLKEDEDVTTVQATLDARLFKYHIAKALGITHRFVGEEPFSPPTEIYNKAMRSVFDSEPDAGLPTLVIIPRVKHGDRAISASDVRRRLAQGDIDGACELVPPTTAAFLRSDECAPIREKLAADPKMGAKDADS